MKAINRPVRVDLPKCLAAILVLTGLFILTACGGSAAHDNDLASSSSASSSSGNSASSSSSSSGSSSSNSSSSSSGSVVDASGGLAYLRANGIRGGQLYSSYWMSETGFSLVNSNLDNQAQLDEMTGKGDFFRCAHCHGWDRLGRQGGHSNRAPTLVRPRVADVDLARISATITPLALFEKIKSSDNYRSVGETIDTYDPVNNSGVGDKMPNYSEILTDAQIWDLVKFLREEALDTTALYDIVLLGGQYPRSRGFINMGVEGSPIAGERLFSEKCSGCHGADGTELSLDDGLYTVGRYIRSKPHEAQHIVKFGHLGSLMGPVLQDSALGDIQDLFAAMRDADKYPDTKPDPLPEPEPIDGTMAFLRHCSGCHSGASEGPSRPRYGDVTGASASLIRAMIENEPNMRHLKPDDPAQAVSLEEVDAIAAFLGR